MLSFTHLLLLPLVFWLAGVSGQIVMTQTPSMLPVTIGQTATITCKASSSIGKYLAWYQQKAGERPKLLIYDGTTLFTGVSSRFSGRQESTTFHLTISNVQSEDIADYYYRAVAKPVLTVLPPSAKEMSDKGTATLLCLANGFFPDTLQLEWQKDQVSVSNGVKTSGSVKGDDNTYSVSSTLTLTKESWQSDSSFSCVITHDTGTLTQTVRVTECV